MVEWSRALDVRLSEWCCSVSMVWVQIPSTALKSNSNTVWFNFQTYIYKHVSPEALITGRMIPSRTPQAEVSSNKLAQYLKTRYFGCWKCKYIYITFLNRVIKHLSNLRYQGHGQETFFFWPLRCLSFNLRHMIIRYGISNVFPSKKNPVEIVDFDLLLKLYSNTILSY